MRLTQTSLYFEPEQVTGANPKVEDNPGVAFAWFKYTREAAHDVHALAVFRDYSVPFGGSRAYAVDAFLDSALRNVPFSFVVRGGPILNGAAIAAIKTAEIVVEQSPVTGIEFAALLRCASNVAIGSYLGMQASGGSTPLMFIFVPAGILVVCSAAGIGKALEKGLNRQIAAIFEGKTPPILKRRNARRRRSG